MATKLYFKSELYNSVKNFAGQHPGRTATVPSAAAGGAGGTGIINSVTQSFGVVGHDVTYNPATGRWLIVADSGGASLFATYAAYADDIEGPWTVTTGVFDSANAYCLIGCEYAFGKYYVLDDTNGVIWSSTTAETGTWALSFTPPIQAAGRTLNFINGRLISCMNGPAICWTTDGTNWTQTTLPGGSGIAYAVDYSPQQGRWIVTGDNATVWWSTDFVTWTRVNLQGSTNNTRAVKWNATLGLWVVAGNGGFIATTSDPTQSNTWTTRTSGTTNLLIDIVTNGTVYIAVGDLKTMVRSTDLVNWTAVQETTDTTDWWRARYIDNKLILIGERSPNLLWYTDNNGVSSRIFSSHKSRNIAQPGLLSVSGKPVMTEDALSLRVLGTTPGTAQVAAPIHSIATVTTQTGLLGRFATYPIANESVVIGAGSIILNSAEDNAGSTNMNWWANSVNIYVWRPSTESIVGYILDAAGFILNTKTPTAGETVTHITGILGAPVTAIEGDVLVVEVWTTFTQLMATAYQGNWYYNGTTENATQGTTVTNHASYIQFTEDIGFKTGRANFYSYTSV